MEHKINGLWQTTGKCTTHDRQNTTVIMQYFTVAHVPVFLVNAEKIVSLQMHVGHAYFE